MTTTSGDWPGSLLAEPSLNGHGSTSPAGASRLRDRLPQARRQHRLGMAALGVLLTALFAVASAGLVLRGDHTVAVLALARDVPAGTALTLSDLRVAHLSGSGVSAVSAAAEPQILGQSLLASLPMGTLLTSPLLSRGSVPAVGTQLVAVAVKPGLVPREVTAGRMVSLVSINTTGTASGTGDRGSAAQVLVGRAPVLSLRTDPTNGLVLLSVQVSDAQAPAVAQAAAAGQLAVTLLPLTPTPASGAPGAAAGATP